MIYRILLTSRKKSFYYAWRLCRAKRLSIVLREGRTPVGSEISLLKKKDFPKEVFLLRVETLPSKTIEYRFARGENPRRE